MDPCEDKNKLGADEKLIKEDKFATNLAFFWIKSSLCLTNKRLTGRVPNAMLGFIRVGNYEIVHPVKSISSVSCSTRLHHWKLIIGLFFLLCAAFRSFESFLCFILGLILLLKIFEGKYEIDNPKKSISSVSFSNKLYRWRWNIGFLLSLILLFLFYEGILSFESFIYFVVASLFLLVSFATQFEVFTNTARPQGFEVSILEKEKMKIFVSEITKLVTKL